MYSEIRQREPNNSLWQTIAVSKLKIYGFILGISLCLYEPVLHSIAHKALKSEDWSTKPRLSMHHFIRSFFSIPTIATTASTSGQTIETQTQFQDLEIIDCF